MKSARLLSIAYNSYTKPKSHESSRYNLWLSHVRLYLRINLRRCMHVETSSLYIYIYIYNQGCLVSTWHFYYYIVSYRTAYKALLRLNCQQKVRYKHTLRLQTRGRSLNKNYCVPTEDVNLRSDLAQLGRS